MEVIRDTVQKVIRDLKTKKEDLRKENPELFLKQILSKKESKHIQFNYFRKGILGLNVDSSVWLYHLSLKKEDLLKGLSKKISGIKDIRLRLGGIK